MAVSPVAEAPPTVSAVGIAQFALAASAETVGVIENMPSIVPVLEIATMTVRAAPVLLLAPTLTAVPIAVVVTFPTQVVALHESVTDARTFCAPVAVTAKFTREFAGIENE